MPALLTRFAGIDLSWTSGHTVELGVLGALLVTSYVSYALAPGAPQRMIALFVACNACMVLAPRILWLHHDKPPSVTVSFFVGRDDSEEIVPS